MNTNTGLLRSAALAVLLTWPAWSTETGLVEEVVTAATKKTTAESAQDVPLAMSLLDGGALAERQAIDLGDLTLAMPNVAFDGVGTARGIANFTIRGQGIAGSIPSIDPTVGVFVDGMYLGVNYGVIVDMLDLEALEVLRGPQGVLFGRNVTGGAVLLRSRRPSGRPSASGSLRVESGVEWRLAGAVERPLVDDVLDLRLAGSFRDDAGWFENSAPGGGALGAESAWVVRPTLAWTPTDDLDVTVILERGDLRAPGPVTQNRRRFGGFDVAIDEPGFADVDWQHLIVEANRAVGDGRGRLTKVFGWRELDHEALTDTDSTAAPIFHGRADMTQQQISNELRYSRTLGSGGDVTLGAYFFSQQIRNRERRMLREVWGDVFGGNQDHVTGGVFVNANFALGAGWVLTTGARYTVEEKDVRVATLGRAGCVAQTGECRFDFVDGDAWRNVTPKVGVQRRLGEDAQMYAHYTKGFRSGGYNLRSTSPAPPGPFDEEEQDSFEAGLKSQLLDGRLRLNVAAFHNRIRDMQRQVTWADAVLGGVQVTANTADATIRGVEVETVAALGPAATASAFVGYTHGRYDEVRYDLTGDGTTEGDEDLDLPRLARLSWGVEAKYERGRVDLRVGLTHRDGSFASDDNTAILKGGELLDMSLRYSPTDEVDVTLFARNLLNEPFWMMDVDLSVLLDATFSPLREGRVLGLDVRVRR